MVWDKSVLDWLLSLTFESHFSSVLNLLCDKNKAFVFQTTILSGTDYINAISISGWVD